MSEAEITQLLQANLAQYRIKVVVRQRQDHLHILLTRPPGPAPNYDGLSGQVRNRLLGLSLDSISTVTLYGREAGSQRQEKYEWEQSYEFDPQKPESLSETAAWDKTQVQSFSASTDRDGPTIVSPKDAAVDLRDDNPDDNMPDDNMVDDYPEDDAPTELYGTVSSNPFRTPEPEEGSYSTQTRQEQIPTGKTKEKKKSGGARKKAVIGILAVLAGVMIVIVVVLLAGR
ncbi:MAG: hypothetical protein HC818_04050 [Synechococcaceae cyanobacterium RM1_1_27]|nr:hypothetical protein [Synechococcaceae cyanobacterium RM1_1_27]